MNYLKLLTITLLLIPGFVILSTDTTYATESIVDIIHLAAFAIYIGMMIAIAKYTNLFKLDFPVASGDINPELARFLHAEGVLDQFLRNTTAYNKKLKEHRKETRSMKEIHIMDAFSWIHTPEGFEFWEKIRNKWNEKIEKKL